MNGGVGVDDPDYNDNFSDWVECWNCGGEGRVEDDDPWWPTDTKCEICKGAGGWLRPEPDVTPTTPNAAGSAE